MSKQICKHFPKALKIGDFSVEIDGMPYFIMIDVFGHCIYITPFGHNVQLDCKLALKFCKENFPYHVCVQRFEIVIGYED